jgi:cyclopropane fatty-acyl-phospholipid synthase-like methyltransferase
MKHKFDAKSKHKLDNPQRRELLPPLRTLILMGLRDGDVMADIGCGIGYFTVPASDIVGDSGKVYAVDVSEEMLSDVEKIIEEKNISNVETMLTDGSMPGLEHAGVTFAFTSNVLHEIDDVAGFIRDIRGMLADKGRMAVVEWEKTDSEYGPPKDHRLGKADLAKIMVDAGFKNISLIDLGENFYGMIAY